MNKMTFNIIGVCIAFVTLQGACPDEVTAQTRQKTVERVNAKEHIASQPPWYRNAFRGFSISTPAKMTEIKGVAIPDGYEDYFKDLKIFLYKSDMLGVQLIYIESSFVTYDLEEGLKSGIGNQLNGAETTDLNLEFVKGDFKNPSLYCNGHFTANGQRGLVKGVGYFKNGKIFNVVCYTFNDSFASKKSLDQIISSLRIIE